MYPSFEPTSFDWGWCELEKKKQPLRISDNIKFSIDELSKVRPCYILFTWQPWCNINTHRTYCCFDLWDHVSPRKTYYRQFEANWVCLLTNCWLVTHAKLTRPFASWMFFIKTSLRLFCDACKDVFGRILVFFTIWLLNDSKTPSKWLFLTIFALRSPFSLSLTTRCKINMIFKETNSFRNRIETKLYFHDFWDFQRNDVFEVSPWNKFVFFLAFD